MARLGVGAGAVRTEALPRLLDVHDRTKLAAGLPADVPVAHKTGYNANVKADGGIAYLRRGPVVMAVMTWAQGGVSDGTGDPFIARVAADAARRLADGGSCGGLPLR